MINAINNHIKYLSFIPTKNNDVKNTQEIKINIPISGCNTSKIANIVYKINETIIWRFSILLNLDNIFETVIIKKGFIISDGCKEKPNILIQRLAPLFCVPTNKTIIKTNINIIKQI